MPAIGIGIGPGFGGAIWTPAANWPTAESPGFWLDQTSFANIYQDSTGTSPATAVEQPAGLTLDKRFDAGFIAVGGLTFTKTQGDGILSVAGNQITVTGATIVTHITITSNIPYASGIGRMQIRADYAEATGVLSWLRGAPVALASGATSTRVLSLNNSNFERLDVGSGTVVFTLFDLSYWRGNHFSQPSAPARPIIKLLDGVQCHSLDGLDDIISTGPSTYSGLLDLVLAVRRTSTTGAFLFATAGGSQYLGAMDTTAGATSSGAGTPTYRVNNVDVPGGTAATRAQLAAAVPIGSWCVVEVLGADLSAWTAAAFGAYTALPMGMGLAHSIACPSGDEAARARNRRFVGSKIGIAL